MTNFLISIACAAMLLSSCISCSKFKTVEIKPIDTEFQPLVNEYKKLKIERTGVDIKNSITILFHTLPTPIIGICYWLSDGSREIFIDPKFWYSQTTSDLDRKILLFHELGHCDLNREHSDPLSIMESYHIGGYRFSLDAHYYINELFDESIKESVSVPAQIKPYDNSDTDTCGGIHEKNTDL